MTILEVRAGFAGSGVGRNAYGSIDTREGHGTYDHAVQAALEVAKVKEVELEPDLEIDLINEANSTSTQASEAA